MTEPNGPIIHIPGDVAITSRILGLPVVADDGYHHDPRCHWCKGKADNDTCPRSVRLRQRVADLDLTAQDDPA